MSDLSDLLRRTYEEVETRRIKEREIQRAADAAQIEATIEEVREAHMSRLWPNLLQAMMDAAATGEKFLEYPVSPVLDDYPGRASEYAVLGQVVVEALQAKDLVAAVKIDPALRLNKNLTVAMTSGFRVFVCTSW